MRIIIVEQDAALGLFLKKGLAVEGHEVRWTSSCEEAVTIAESVAPDLVVLGVADEKDLELLQGLHAAHRRTAMLTLTRSTAVEDRVRCLNLGADDCMTKPFSFHELTARCRALLRRRERSGEITLTQGSLSLNRISRSASLAGRPVSLTTKEFRLLEFLLQNSGRCCSRTELLTEVFDLPAENATNVVDVYINYLRGKLSFAEEPPLIVTVRGAGYRMARTHHGIAPAPVAHAESNLHASA
ncbi:MAG: response regulator transcription factor [Acidobacteriaceae bacterium]